MHPYRLLLDPRGDEGNGDPTPTPTATPTPTPTPTPKKRETVGGVDTTGEFESLIARHGGVERALGYVLGENRNYRRKLREAQASGKLPEGSVVLSRDEATAWESYKALGTAEDLSAAVKDRDRFRDEADGFRRAEVHKQAAEAHGYRGSVLSRLIDQEKLDIEVKDETVAGKAARVAYVKGVDDKGKPTETKLPDYVKAHWSEFLPSLAIETPRAPVGTPTRADPSGPPPDTNTRKPQPSLATGF